MPPKSPRDLSGEDLAAKIVELARLVEEGEKLVALRKAAWQMARDEMRHRESVKRPRDPHPEMLGDLGYVIAGIVPPKYQGNCTTMTPDFECHCEPKAGDGDGN